MANNVIKRIWNQNTLVNIEALKGAIFQDEDGGHTFEISGVDNSGNAISLSGTVAGVFLRPDNTDVPITGSASGGIVSVTLPAECYDVSGRFGLTVFVTADSKKTCVYAAIGTVGRTSSGSVAPGTSADVVDLINQISAAVATIPASWSGLMADIAPTYSTSAAYPVGAYVYYNGDLYRCTTAITTGETWTAAHWTTAVLGNDVSDLKTATDKLQNTVFADSYYTDWIQYPLLISDTAVGSVLDITELGGSNNYYRQVIPVSAGDIFVIQTYAASTYGQYALTDENYVILHKEDSGSSADIKTITVVADGYLAVQGHKNYPRVVYQKYADNAFVSKNQGTSNARKVMVVNNDGFVIADDMPNMDKLITKITAATTSGAYINKSGAKTSNNSFMYSDPIYLRSGMKLYAYARGYSTTVCIISQTHYDNVEHFPLVNCTDGNARWYECYILRNGYYCICGNIDTPFVIYTVAADREDDTKVSLSMFQKFGVIGDSYASGVIYPTYGQSVERYSCSWGQILARKCGTVCTNYSHGGLSTRTWLTSSLGLAKLLANEPEDIYYCALGINDYGQLGEDYLGSLTDITSHSEMSEYGDTFYGNYGRIIENIKAHAPHALIVMFTCANTNTVPQKFSDAIVEIANYYEIPYIVQAEDPYFQSAAYTQMMGGHPTSVGYGGMASAFERLLQGAIQTNRAYFAKAYAYLDS